jgi:hypothetical protein
MIVSLCIPFGVSVCMSLRILYIDRHGSTSRLSTSAEKRETRVQNYAALSLERELA